MAIEIEFLVILFSISFIPFIVIGAARWRTLLYRRNVLKGKTQLDSSRLPILVRLNKFILSKASISVGVYIVAELIFFGIPLITAVIFWPEDFRALAELITIPAVILTVFILLQVVCESPDQTGGFGNLSKVDID